MLSDIIALVLYGQIISRNDLVFQTEESLNWGCILMLVETVKMEDLEMLVGINIISCHKVLVWIEFL